MNKKILSADDITLFEIIEDCNGSKDIHYYGYLYTAEEKTIYLESGEQSPFCYDIILKEGIYNHLIRLENRTTDTSRGIVDYGKGTGYRKRQKILNELFDKKPVTCLTSAEQFNDLPVGIYAMVDKNIETTDKGGAK